MSSKTLPGFAAGILRPSRPGSVRTTSTRTIDGVGYLEVFQPDAYTSDRGNQQRYSHLEPGFVVWNGPLPVGPGKFGSCSFDPPAMFHGENASVDPSKTTFHPGYGPQPESFVFGNGAMGSAMGHSRIDGREFYGSIGWNRTPIRADPPAVTLPLQLTAEYITLATGGFLDGVYWVVLHGSATSETETMPPPAAGSLDVELVIDTGESPRYISTGIHTGGLIEDFYDPGLPETQTRIYQYALVGWVALRYPWGLAIRSSTGGSINGGFVTKISELDPALSVPWASRLWST